MSPLPFTKQPRLPIWRARDYALASQLAYKPEMAIKRQAACWEFYEAKVFEHNSARAFLMARPDLIVISFEGTNDIKDWLRNAKAHKEDRDWLPGRAHAGFLEHHEQLWARIERAISEALAEFPGAELALCGHSLGGAVASLAALRLAQRRDVRIAGLFTFGCPRVGNRALARALERMLAGRIFRYRHNNDLVPCLPLLLWLFRHPRPEFYLSCTGKLWRNAPRWRIAIDRIRGYGRALVARLKRWRWRTDGLADHEIDRYVAALVLVAEKERV